MNFKLPLASQQKVLSCRDPQEFEEGEIRALDLDMQRKHAAHWSLNLAMYATLDGQASQALLAMRAALQTAEGNVHVRQPLSDHMVEKVLYVVCYSTLPDTSKVAAFVQLIDSIVKQHFRNISSHCLLSFSCQQGSIMQCMLLNVMCVCLCKCCFIHISSCKRFHVSTTQCQLRSNSYLL